MNALFVARNVGRASALALGVALFGAGPAAAAAELPSPAEMWKIIQEQQQQLLQQQMEINKLKRGQRATEEKVEATGEMIEKVQEEEPSQGWWSNTQIGGYGELHYNAGEKDELDFHRFVLFLGHDFTDDIHFFSELEVEHAFIEDTGDGSTPGEIELEQAFIEFDFFEDRHKVDAGVFLVPVGILNETHEPPTFFGVERNLVETNIIPATWWEGGAGVRGELGGGFSYDLFIHSGLKTPTTGSKAFKIRNGRQKVAKARAEDGAVTGRIKWTGIPGVEVGVTGQYQRDITQGAQLVPGDDLDIAATLIEAHTDIRRGPFGFRALVARWDLAGAAPKVMGRDTQWGWYVEPAYYFDTPVGEVGVFGRYLEFDNEAGDDVDSKFQQIDVGLNFWPHPDVVLKFDYNLQFSPDGVNEDNRFNLGLGYQF